MQFTSIIATLSIVLAATALPSPNPPAQSCTNGQVSCCPTSQDGTLNLNILDCILPVATCGILNGQLACCDNSGTQNGINVNVCQVL